MARYWPPAAAARSGDEPARIADEEVQQLDWVVALGPELIRGGISHRRDVLVELAVRD